MLQSYIFFPVQGNPRRVFYYRFKSGLFVEVTILTLFNVKRNETFKAERMSGALLL